MTTPRLHRPRFPRAAATAAGALGLLLAALAAPAAASPDRYADSPGASGYDDYDAGEVAGYDAGYSYIRVLEGSATLIQGSESGDPADADRDQAVVNQPVLAGDRLWVAPRSRAEVLLSDGNLLRLDADSEAAFESLAFSPESGDRVTTLRLLRGNAQLVVITDSLGEQLPRLDTPNATVYPQDFGVYRVTTEGGDWTEVVVRRGRAEVVTATAALTVDADRRALIEGRDRPWTEVQAASGYDALERWAAELDRRGSGHGSPYVDDDLRYAAAPLDDYGRWIEVGGSRAWSPRVETGWRPYWHGYWSHTPAGLIWISSEPWGWVPYHYGTWDYAPGYGWVWFPGRRFAPAWVYWYWGDRYAAWVPVGYYTRHYHGHPGFRFGVYGWAGGHSGFFADWVFCDRIYFGRRFQRGHFFDGHDWGRHGHGDVPRGILTTDTRRLTPRLWRDGEGSLRALRTRPGAGGRVAIETDLPDVTAFVARRGESLPADVERRVAVPRGQVDRVAGTPLAPGTEAPRVRVAVPKTGARGGGTAGETPSAASGEGGLRVRAVRPSGTRAPAGGADRSPGRAGRPGVVERTPPAAPPSGETRVRSQSRPAAPAAGGAETRDDDRRPVTRAPAPRRDDTAGERTAPRGGSGNGAETRRVRPRATEPDPSPQADEREAPRATAPPRSSAGVTRSAPRPRDARTPARDGSPNAAATGPISVRSATPTRATGARAPRPRTPSAPPRADSSAGAGPRVARPPASRAPSTDRSSARAPRPAPRAQAPSRSRSEPATRAQAPSRTRSNPAPRATAPSGSRSNPAPRARTPSRSRSNPAPRAQAPSRSRSNPAPRARTQSRSRSNPAPRARTQSRSRSNPAPRARTQSRSRSNPAPRARTQSRSRSNPAPRAQAPSRSRGGGSAASRSGGSRSRRSGSSARSNRGESGGSVRPR